MNGNFSPKRFAIASTSVIVLILAGLFIRSYRASLSHGGPNVFLPARVVAPDGEITLYADYERAEAGRIPVYFVNRSGRPIETPHQDGDLYLKQEYRNDAGEWVRAQPHTYSWCGNSYFAIPPMPDGRYRVLSGTCPIAGKPARIRYRLYSPSPLRQLVSNETDGFIDERAVAEAAIDVMAVRFGSLDFVRRVARREIAPEKKPPHELYDPRHAALNELSGERFEKEETTPLLEELAADDDDSIARRARDTLDFRFRRGRYADRP